MQLRNREIAVHIWKHSETDRTDLVASNQGTGIHPPPPIPTPSSTATLETMTIGTHLPNPPQDIIQIPEDEEEDPCILISCQGSDKKNPISVEEYADEVLLQRANTASSSLPHGIIHLDDNGEGNPEDQKGRIHIIGHRTAPQRRPRKRLFTKHSVTGIRKSSNCSAIDVDALIDIDLDVDVASTSTVSPTAFCAICMEPKLLSECFGMKGCSHLFCSECISRYIASKIQENVTVILCPDPGCKNGSLEPEMCRPILPPEVFDRWGAALCEALIIGLMRFYCPYKDCSALLIDETSDGKDEVIRESECPHCWRLFCAQCKVPWHTGVTCEEFQRLGADEREKEDIMLMNVAKKNKWQRCPKCKFFVERSEGCMFMLCRCGHRFCYGCASPMTIDHYCPKCKR